MQTNDTRFTGDVQTYATNYFTEDYKIVYLCGCGNKSGKPVFMGQIQGRRSDNAIQNGQCYTTVQEATLSLLSDMNTAQRKLTAFFREQLDSYDGE